jgi:2'-hydroxyisoflavone reductase
MKLLILGGTKFLGRALVEEALARGHELTLFNRGETNPDLFPEVEKLRGNRDGQLEALRGREWDAVIDTCGYVARIVRQSAELLRERVPHYTFVSSISVYASFVQGSSEEDPIREAEAPDEVDMEYYGERKAECERAVSGAYGEDALLVRPGLIAGPHDPTGRFTYWPHRIARGGDVLAPEPRDAAVQFIDVGDLASFTLKLVEERAAGAYNATGPVPGLTMEQLLERCRTVANPNARLVWVDYAFLRDRDVGEWMELPLWMVDPEWIGIHDADVSKAVAAGLTFRPLEDTIRATLEFAELAESAGLEPKKERELLEEWAATRS